MHPIVESFLQTLWPVNWVVKLWDNEWKINQAEEKFGAHRELPVLLEQVNISEDAYSAYVGVEWISLLWGKTSSSFKKIK